MMPLIRSSIFCFLTVCTLGILVGCGGSNADNKIMGAATGKVTLKGKPVTDCRINFESTKDGIGVGSELKEDGSFTLEGEVPIGSYNVFITPPNDFSPANADSYVGLKKVPPKYRQGSTSGLTAEIKEGDNEINFELK